MLLAGRRAAVGALTATVEQHGEPHSFSLEFNNGVALPLTTSVIGPESESHRSIALYANHSLVGGSEQQQAVIAGLRSLRSVLENFNSRAYAAPSDSQRLPMTPFPIPTLLILDSSTA